MTILIAEISNMHNGDMERAKKLILMAKNAGADLVKGQAFLAEDMLKYGAMNKNFYRICAFKYDQYLELIEFARSHSIDLFYSIISQNYNTLHRHMKYAKVSAAQYQERNVGNLKRSDHDNAFISMGKLRKVKMTEAKLLYAEPYMENMDVSEYRKMGEYHGRPIGISHHNKTIISLKYLKENYTVPVIEKHFFDGTMIKDSSGKLYRDCEHAANPEQFEAIARMFK